MGIKKEAPSLFCFGSHQALPTAQCSDGALIRFDLAHIIEVECVIGLDYQLVLPVLLDVKGVPLVVVGELPVLWMLRNVVFVTEKRSHASKLQNTLGSVHDGDLILRHQSAHISDDEYFSQMVRDDLNLIIRDIREAHKKDSESAPQTTVADELKENLEAVENFKGSRDEKLVVLYCKQLGINYKNLSDEEFRWLIRILKKSKKMGTPISQRKKR